MASRKGGWRRGGKQSSSLPHHSDMDWTLKPNQEHQPSQSSHDFALSSSRPDLLDNPSTTAPAKPVAQFVLTNRKNHQNRRNSRWASRNRRPQVVKAQNFKESEVGSSSTDEIIDEKGRTSGESEVVSLGIGNTGRGREDSGDFLGVECDEGCSNHEIVEVDEEMEGKIQEADDEDVDAVQKRLQELLLLRSEEPELSEEQLRINDQAQEDELLAMESICGDSIFILDRQNGLRSFQIHIDIETPKEVSIFVKLTSSTVSETQDDSSEFSYSFKVDYLPPIILTCVLPQSYPSHHPPCLTLSVQWLNSTKISALCGVLDSIWKEQSGQEVIYQWVEWLHSSCLSFLGFEQAITLGPYGGRDEGDRRAISGIVSAEVDVLSIRSYSDEQRHENFSRNLHDCCICFSEFAGTEFARLPCQHIFCWTCMKTYSDMHVKEGTVNKLVCPDAKCGGTIPPGLLRRLLGDEEFERWESMMLQKTLDSMADVTYCPRCETICIEDEDQHALCSKCFFSFCTLCRERRHVGVACMTTEMKLHILKERLNSLGNKVEQIQRDKEKINELLSEKEIARSAKPCPSCKMQITRTEGCNKMVCRNCGSYFCYSCGAKVDGYEHFRDGGCKLFPAEEIQMWEERMNPRQAVGQIQAQIHAGRGHPCPICGQVNVKVENNNHIFCWACQSHYCYLCKKIVRRSSQHYGGPNRCKQHSADL